MDAYLQQYLDHLETTPLQERTMTLSMMSRTQAKRGSEVEDGGGIEREIYLKRAGIDAVVGGWKVEDNS